VVFTLISMLRRDRDSEHCKRLEWVLIKWDYNTIGAGAHGFAIRPFSRKISCLS